MFLLQSSPPDQKDDDKKEFIACGFTAPGNIAQFEIPFDNIGVNEIKLLAVMTVSDRASDYNEKEIELIRSAKKIYYPSAFYAELFDTAGIHIFPSYQTYKYAQDKIKQTALFELLGIPHPKTRFFYGS